MAEPTCIVEFTRKTIYGCCYNEGERAAFPEKDAQVLLHGDPVSGAKPSALLLKTLTAAQVEALSAKAPETLVSVNVAGMTPAEVKDLKKLLERVNARQETGASA